MSDGGKAKGTVGDGDKAPEEPRGIECPKCGCDLCPVAWTKRHRGFTQRARECNNCGKRFKTRERPMEDDHHGPLGADFMAGN